ncbi:plasmid replication protein-like protein [Streptococcus pneumoniae]|nr:plasmid replication protein-like protein [Streptococcus pneumoniae]
MNGEKTIKEFADELGITKQTIQYHLKFLPTENRQKTDKGVILLSLLEQEIIKDRVRQKSDRKPTEENNFLYEQIKDLKEQNADLRKWFYCKVLNKE